MAMKWSKTKSGNKYFTQDELVKIFAARAGGATLNKLTDDFGGSTWHIGRMLRGNMNNIYGDMIALVPKKLREKVEELNTKHETRTTNGKKRTKRLTHESAASILAQFTAACLELERTRRKCHKLGLPSKTLEVIQDEVARALS